MKEEVNSLVWTVCLFYIRVRFKKMESVRKPDWVYRKVPTETNSLKSSKPSNLNELGF